MEKAFQTELQTYEFESENAVIQVLKQIALMQGLRMTQPAPELIDEMDAEDFEFRNDGF
jgi:hypothetical protein